MRTIILKVNYDGAVTTGQRVIDCIKRNINQTGMLPGRVELLDPLTGRALAEKAHGEAFDNSFEGKHTENYSYGYIAGYNAALENGGGE